MKKKRLSLSPCGATQRGWWCDLETEHRFLSLVFACDLRQSPMCRVVETGRVFSGSADPQRGGLRSTTTSSTVEPLVGMATGFAQKKERSTLKSGRRRTSKGTVGLRVDPTPAPEALLSTFFRNQKWVGHQQSILSLFPHYRDFGPCWPPASWHQLRPSLLLLGSEWS